MEKPHLVTPSDLKVSRFRRSIAPAFASAFLALAVVITSRPPEPPAPPVILVRPAPPPVLPPADRKVQADYERAVDLYAKGRLRDAVVVLEKLPADPSAKRALVRIRAELALQKR